MLVLSRKARESICISDNVVVTVLGIRGRQVRIGIEAPAETPVHRKEAMPTGPEREKPGDKLPKKGSVMESEQKCQLESVATAGRVRAMYELSQQSDNPQERSAWLRRAAEKGYPPAMLSYALECEDSDERRHWLREAAEEGDVAAMYQFALESKVRDTRTCWLRRAADSGNLAAMHSLAMEWLTRWNAAPISARPPARATCRQCMTLRSNATTSARDADGWSRQPLTASRRRSTNSTGSRTRA